LFEKNNKKVIKCRLVLFFSQLKTKWSKIRI